MTCLVWWRNEPAMIDQSSKVLGTNIPNNLSINFRRSLWGTPRPSQELKNGSKPWKHTLPPPPNVYIQRCFYFNPLYVYIIYSIHNFQKWPPRLNTHAMVIKSICILSGLCLAMIPIVVLLHFRVWCTSTWP